MRFAGKITRCRDLSGYYYVRVPALGMYTQGRNERDAYFMAADWLECMIDKPDFKAVVYPGKGGYFEIGSNDDKAVLAFYIDRIRTFRPKGSDWPKLDSRQKRNFKRYIKGGAVPSITRLSEIARAVGTELVISESRTPFPLGKGKKLDLIKSANINAAEED